LYEEREKLKQREEAAQKKIQRLEKALIDLQSGLTTHNVKKPLLKFCFSNLQSENTLKMLESGPSGQIAEQPTS
jgi:hypothetical protein